MSEFKKYSSIGNSYQSKPVLYWLKAFPELKDETFILREKLDGANIQLYFEPDQPMRVGKRSSFLTEGAGFFGIWDVLPKYEAELHKFQWMADYKGKSFRIFGELFGPGINGRVDYGKEKQICIYDIYEGEDLWSQQDLEDWTGPMMLKHLLAPVVAIVEGLNNALEFNPEFDSKVLRKKGNFAEGFVMQPLKKVYRLPSGDRFLLKKKADKFKERENKGSVVKTREPLHPNVIRLVSLFAEYINENRVISVFSKQGPIESQKQLGDYIKLVLEDAKEDFLKDNPDLELDKETAKTVFNCGRTIVDLLKAHL